MDLQIANLNDRLDFAEPETFDLIHSRFVADGIASSRWPNYFRDMYRLLKRNGWVQVTEWDLTFRSATGNSDALQALREWSQLHAQSLAASNRPEGRKRGRVTQDCEAWMRMAGFVDVSADVRDIPTSPWPTDSHGRSIGQANLSNMKDALRSLALYPATHRQFRTIEQFNEIVNAACSELENIQAKPYLRLYFLPYTQTYVLRQKAMIRSMIYYSSCSYFLIQYPERPFVPAAKTVDFKNTMPKFMELWYSGIQAENREEKSRNWDGVESPGSRILQVNFRDPAL
ncbi:hypothetical protein LTR10_013659 [Elasticomyces elasticus]|nr:hypothetical protein LTR10_013659 [Elasticomyces elasticus]KAK5042137.1 hypothetical protein LTR13_001943 [Exophiala sideris]KAK5185405.1 hypothetical protein LTR44_002394 [Eurotiomycetes sp. CCFEE 6388]